MSVYNRLEPEMTSEVTHHVGFVFKDHNIYIYINCTLNYNIAHNNNN